MTQRKNSTDEEGRRRQPHDDEAPYEVGYGKPPAAHRFQKGQSGNPSGSKRKHSGKQRSKTLKAELMDELGQKIAVTEGGRRRHVPRQTAFVKKLVADALNGDAKARTQLIQLANKAETNSDAAEAEDLIGAAKDAEILERFRADVIRKYQEANDE